MQSLSKMLRLTRILHAVFVFTIFQFLILLYFVKPAGSEISSSLVAVFAVVAIGDFFVGLSIRSAWLGRSVEALKKDPNDQSAIQRWYVGQIISFAFAETIVLLGLTLQFIGGQWKFSAAFFVAGFVLMLFYYPKVDPALLRQ